MYTSTDWVDAFFGVAITSIICLIPLLILVGAIVAAIFLVKRSKEQTLQSEANLNNIMKQIPDDKQILFMMQYNNTKKNPTTAVLLALFLGGVGAHKFYMGDIGMGILYLLFSWTYIPAIIGLIEAFTISSTAAKYNERKAESILMMITGYR